MKKKQNKKKTLSVSRMMAERNISLSNWPGIAFFFLFFLEGGGSGCTHVERPNVLIFKQHLSSPLHQRLLARHTHNVSSPQGCSLCSGHMDNSIPVVELEIKQERAQTRALWPLSDSQGIRFLWTVRAANSTEELRLLSDRNWWSGSCQAESQPPDEPR